MSKLRNYSDPAKNPQAPTRVPMVGQIMHMRLWIPKRCQSALHLRELTSSFVLACG